MRTDPPYPVRQDEESRLKALREYALLDTPPERDFDHLVALAAGVFSVPTVLISLLDEHRQFFKARFGSGLGETPREASFCNHTVLRDEVLYVPDARLDPDFASNPQVSGEPHIRFYAGAPLVTPSGHAIGTLCLTDTRPRHDFSPEQAKTLKEIAALVMDRMEMRRLDLERNASQSRFQNIAGTSPDGIVCTDSSGAITFWNAAAEQMFGYSAAEALGRNIDMLVPERSRVSRETSLASAVALGGGELIGETVELDARRADGSEFPMELSLSMWRDGREMSFGAIIRDATDRRENEARLSRLAHLDPLTELPNRAALWAKLDGMLAADKPVAALLLDLDDFKEVNDVAGHMWGDRVLRCVVRRIRTALGEDDVAARLGGDEFVVLMENVGDPLVAAAMADRLMAAMEPPFEIDGQPVHLGISIGIAVAPAHGETAEELLANVDLALYRAKDEGRERHHLFMPTMRQAAIARRTCETELRDALAKGEFELFFQPQVRLRDSSLVGAEALLRWRHPERGLLAPAAFISVLDSLPLAAEVGDWVIHSACAQAAEWRAAGVDDFKVGVNLFGAQFRYGSLVETVETALIETTLPAEALELEITENIILRHEKQMTEQLRVLCRRGVGIAFDDYGTGFASLSQLKLFPLTKLKIDQSFVREMCCDSQDATVVKAILHLGRNFGVKVIAEGIELLQQHDVLLENGCDEGQGFLYGRAMAAGDFEPRLMAWRQVA